MLRWHSFSEWGSEHVSLVFSYKGCRFIRKEQRGAKVNILWLTVGYLNATINRKARNTEPEIGTDESSRTRQNPQVDWYGSRFGPPRRCGSGFGRFWNWTEPFSGSNPDLLLTLTPPNQILQFQVCLPTRKSRPTFSKRRKNTQQWILRPQPQEYAVVVPTKYKDPHEWADCVDRFIRVVKQTDKMSIVPVGAIVGPTHLVRENNAASDRIDSIWLVNNHVGLDTYWTMY